MRAKIVGLVLCGSLLLSACDSGNGKKGPNDPPGSGAIDELVTAMPTVAPPFNYNDEPVHDPSVVRADNGDFYVIGSHLAMAWSTDLVNWTNISDGVDDPTLFNTYETEISEGVAYVGGYVGSWASDIIKLADGRWYFYYDHCANPPDGFCNQSRSYLGVAVSDNIDGPYTDLGIFLWSGQTDAELANGDYVVDPAIASYNGTIHPNVIDPDVFYDKNGGLWMVYGSYSGGIFVLEMDDTTGMPLPGQGYGTHIAGGDFSAIEGAYVLYSPDTDYYYLFMSFGGFEANDGYNIRIARSANPNGPYLDAQGNDMTLARGNWDGIEPYGVKLMGGFEFASDVGDPTAGWGYLAPGHNSAYYDAATDKYLLFHHTRFPGRGQEHAVRVHELFVTANDWLVASPQRFAPMTGGNSVSAEDMYGVYRYVNHGKDINRTAKRNRYVWLHADRSIDGDANGSFQTPFDGSSSVDVTIDGATYDSVAYWQWDENAQRLTPVISGIAADGSTIWLSQMEEIPVSSVMQDVADDLDLPAAWAGNSLDFPTIGTRGASISWSTSNGDVIKSDGTVIRPNVGDGDETVTITATISLQGQTTTATFDVMVPQRSTFNRIAQYDFEDDLAETLGNFADGQATGGDLLNIGGGAVGYIAGHDGQAVSFDGTAGVRLPDGLISNYEYTVSFWANPAALTDHTPMFFGAVDGASWLSFLPHVWWAQALDVWSRDDMDGDGEGVWFDAVTDDMLPLGTWSHVAFSVRQGLVKVYIDGVEQGSNDGLADFFTRNVGLFALGVNFWPDPPFNGLIDELKIYDAALDGGEVTALDIDYTPSNELLQIAVDILDLGDLSAVKSDLYLPRTGPFAAAVDWVSSDPATISVQADTGIVTRPEEGMPEVIVTLTATVTLDGQSMTRDFFATVPPLGPPEPIAVYSFEDNLDDSTGNFASGTSTGDRITTPGGNLTYDVGAVGQALILDGASGVALDTNLVTDDSYTLSMWLNPTSFSAYTTALFGGPNCAADGATCNSWISVLPGGFDAATGQTMLWSGTAWYDALTGTRIPAGSWSHFVAVNEFGNARLYIDGVEMFNGLGFPDVFSGTVNPQFWIAVNHWDLPYNGGIDELKFFDEALTADEVAQLFQAESAP